MPEGSRWSPVPAVVQVLLTRAWLRGAALADDPPHEQLRCILSDEMGAESDPTARCTPWREYLDRTKGWHERLRIGLREMTGTPQVESRGFGLADVSLAVGVILRLRPTLRDRMSAVRGQSVSVLWSIGGGGVFQKKINKY